MTLIMVVDDDQDLAEMLGIVLNGAGYEVDLINHGDQALEGFRTNKPDLVLLDVMLPGIDGIEICRQIRAESMVPIVMLTAKSDSHEVVQGLEAGADDYMVKPFKSSELVARLKVRLRRTPVMERTHFVSAISRSIKLHTPLIATVNLYRSHVLNLICSLH